jgi:hypothetical protein
MLTPLIPERLLLPDPLLLMPRSRTIRSGSVPPPPVALMMTPLTSVARIEPKVPEHEIGKV